MNIRISWHILGLAALIAAAVVAAVLEIGPPTSSARTSREVVTAADGIIQSTVTGTGNVEAGTDVEANFQTSGTLQHVYVSEGDHVVKGQLVATLDPTSAQLTVDQAQENLTAAQDDLTNAEDQSTSTSTTSDTAPRGPGVDRVGGVRRLQADRTLDHRDLADDTTDGDRAEHDDDAVDRVGLGHRRPDLVGLRRSGSGSSSSSSRSGPRRTIGLVQSSGSSGSGEQLGDRVALSGTGSGGSGQTSTTSAETIAGQHRARPRRRSTAPRRR